MEQKRGGCPPLLIIRLRAVYLLLVAVGRIAQGQRAEEGLSLTLELEQTTEPDGSVHCAVRGPKLHVTVTHYDAGKSNVRTYLFRDYTPELAQAHGVRAAYPSFGYDYIRQTAQTYINSEFLELA